MLLLPMSSCPSPNMNIAGGRTGRFAFFFGRTWSGPTLHQSGRWGMRRLHSCHMRIGKHPYLPQNVRQPGQATRHCWGHSTGQVPVHAGFFPSTSLHETTLPAAGADDGELELLDGDGGLSFLAHTRVVARRHRRLALSTPMAMDGMIGLGRCCNLRT
jgi:hypothetical protein